MSARHLATTATHPVPTTRPGRAAVLAALGGAAVAALAVAAPASAHPGHGTSLWAGLSHPFLGVDHVLAMVTVGLLGALAGGRARLAYPGVFLAAMALGGALGLAGFAFASGDAAVALTVVALGGGLVAGRAVGAVPAAALVAVAGVIHGHAHGVEAPAAAHPARYVGAFLVSTTLLHAAGLLGGRALLERPRRRVALGALVLGAGLGLLVGA